MLCWCMFEQFHLMFKCLLVKYMYIGFSAYRSSVHVIKHVTVVVRSTIALDYVQTSLPTGTWFGVRDDSSIVH